jgi:hypothetical protein
MPGKKSRPASTRRQWNYFGVLASRGVGWAKDKLRGRHPPTGRGSGGKRGKKG